VDTLTEALVQRGMQALMQDRTTLIIAHRLSTVKRADRILVIEAGGIVEEGTHASLLRRRGHYFRMYTRQFRYELERQYGLESTDKAAIAEEPNPPDASQPLAA
jgi:ATP-binding cassette subfamily B protein